MYELVNYNKVIRDLIIKSTDIDANNVRQMGQSINLSTDIDSILFTVNSFKTFNDPYKRGAYYCTLINPTYLISCYGKNAFNRACDLLTYLDSTEVQKDLRAIGIGINSISDIILLNEYIGEEPIIRADITLKLNSKIEKENKEFLEKFRIQTHNNRS